MSLLREVRDWLEELACRAGIDGLPAMSRTAWVAAALVVAGLVAWTVWGAPAQGRASGSPGAGEAEVSNAPSLPSAQGSRESTVARGSEAHPATVTVHVVGEVRHPGVYELAGGSRARDAVDAAGGLLGDAEQSAVNLARAVADGEQILVPRQGEAAPAASGAGAAGTAPSSGKVNLNTATAEQLDALPGVGPSTAGKIVADREANGPFRSVDDLMRVSGIGPAKFGALKDLVTAG